MKDEPTPKSGAQPQTAVRSTDWLDDDDDEQYYYDPERDCPNCHGAGQTALISGIEWDYTGPDWDTCPRCGGSGRW